MASVDIAAAWRRGQQGWPARFVLLQVPNPPLILAFAARVLAARAHGRTRHYIGMIGRLSLAVFAVLEIVSGANWLRRLVGAIVLLRIPARRRGHAR